MTVVNTPFSKLGKGENVGILEFLFTLLLEMRKKKKLFIQVNRSPYAKIFDSPKLRGFSIDNFSEDEINPSLNFILFQTNMP